MSKIIGVTVGTPTSPTKMEDALNPVKTVNGIEPDENGNVEIETDIADGVPALKVADDGNGNVSLSNVPTTDDDFIVEQGRSENGWEYRKWNSGRAECWKNVTATVKTTDWKDSGMMSFLSYGLFWTSGIPIEFPYPFTFTEHPVETAILSNGTVWFPLTLISTTHLQNNKTDSYRLCTYKIPDQNISVKIALSVFGKWK